jgi:hypothetical protein
VKIFIRLVALVPSVILGMLAHGRRRRRRPAFDLNSLSTIAPRRVSPKARRLVLDSTNIRIIHGETSDAGSGGEFLVVEDSVDLPAFATEAMVFLNGWSLEYLDDDHHLQLLGTYLENSEVRDGRLHWRATGFLQDQNGDDPFEWHYFYTVVAWNSDVIRCGANHTTFQDWVSSHDSTRLPVVSSSSRLQLGGLNPPTSSVVLPRGFVFWYPEFDDHHVRHLGYNLAFSANTRAEHSQDSDGGPGAIGAGFTSWNTHAIMQDNTYHPFRFWHWNATVGGSGASVIQPPFTILPTRVEVSIGSPSTADGHKTRDIEVQGVPFDFAVPVLAGWDLHYDFDDQHVRKMGVWLDDFDYEPPAGPGSTGTLRYRITSALYDNDRYPGFSSLFNIHILGFTESEVNVPSATG